MQPPNDLIEVRDEQGKLLFKFCPKTLRIFIKHAHQREKIVELLPLVRIGTIQPVTPS